MDNMAYLQTIAKQPPSNQSGKHGFDITDIISKIFTIRNIIIAAAVLVIFIVSMIIIGSLNQVDNKDRDYLIESVFASTYLNSLILDEYTEDVKSSTLRTMGTTLKGNLKSIITRNTDTLLSVYGVEIDDYEDSFGAAESTRINTVKNLFADAKLNGTLDRVYVRELTLQIMIIYNYESEVAARTKNDAVKNYTETDMKNLDNIYKQFSDYTDVTASVNFTSNAFRVIPFLI